MNCFIEFDFKPIIKECFSTDPALLETFHIYSGKGLDSCVEKTFQDLSSIKENYNFFKVVSDNNLIGFFGIEYLGNMNALTGFFIKPEYRKNNKEFWNLIKKEIKSNSFLCGIYKKNTRASDFLKKMNGKLIATTPEGLVFKMENN